MHSRAEANKAGRNNVSQARDRAVPEDIIKPSILCCKQEIEQESDQNAPYLSDVVKGVFMASFPSAE